MGQNIDPLALVHMTYLITLALVGNSHESRILRECEPETVNFTVCGSNRKGVSDRRDYTHIYMISVFILSRNDITFPQMLKTDTWQSNLAFPPLKPSPHIINHHVQLIVS